MRWFTHAWKDLRVTTRARHHLLALAGATALVALLGAPALASTDPVSGGASRPVAAAAGDTAPPSAVEDFAYPNAAAILRDKGIKLIKGDGHITLADCDDKASQIKVLTVQGEGADKQGAYCFQANAKTGYLSLELPRVFYLQTADHPITASLTPQGQDTSKGPTQTVNVDKNGHASVGEGVTGGAPAVLLEIRVTG